MAFGTYARAFLFVLAMQGCSEPATAPQNAVPRVKVCPVGERASSLEHEFSGEVVAATTSPLSFGVSGTIRAMYASAGRAVAKDEVLAVLDQEPFRLAVARARSQLGSARAMVDQARQAYRRAQQLVEVQGVSQAEVEAALATLKTAQAALDGYQSALRKAERDFGLTKLLAPFEGQIAEQTADVFQEVGAAETIYVLQASGAVNVKLLVPESLLPRLDYGQAVRVEFPSKPELSLVGSIYLLGAKSDSGRAFPVEVRLEDDGSELRPGMTARVTLSTDLDGEGRDNFVLPLTALAPEHALSTSEQPAEGEVPVFVFDPSSSTLKARTISVRGLRGSRLVVRKGLEEGELVVCAGVPFLRDGMTVEIWSPEER
ncbi:MAG: efflux RND transporter periplasmic adaptor subunit [Myxococcota bacterium]